MNTKTTLSIVVIAAITLSLAFSSVLIASEASAKITSVCKNPGGGEPQGNCRGQALTEENQNPAGKAPPGQN
jgi:hypothetical protein